MKFARAKVATPLLQTADFDQVFGASDGQSLPFDDQRLIRELLLIALPGTKFRLVEKHSELIVGVRSQEYPLLNIAYTDVRFLEEVDEATSERKKTLRSAEQIITHLKTFLGTSYLWGGNWSRGIPEMRHYYPPKVPFETLDPFIQSAWLLQGVDCSGLLYQVTDGMTPRSTHQLIHYGQGLSTQEKTSQQIQEALFPLDLIVWPGHVIIVIDSQNVIESKAGKGVIQTPLDECLNTLLQERKPMELPDTSLSEKWFVIRRWHPQFSLSE